MVWASSTRRSRLPSDWTAVRSAVLKRDLFRCQLRWRGCLSKATEVDHIYPGDDHQPENLQAVCTKCHAKKSAQEGRRSQLTRRKNELRKPEAHPGLRPRREATDDARSCT